MKLVRTLMLKLFALAVVSAAALLAQNPFLAFEAVTIERSKPNTPGKAIWISGRRFSTLNTSLSDLIKFAYGLHARQIIGGPVWLETEKYDLRAQPDFNSQPAGSQPNDEQWKMMLQLLLADRFKLAYHRDKQELPVYAIVVGESGPKLAQSEGDPNGPPSLFFRGPGVLPATNATMADFAGVLQADVLDRPVLDQTGLSGRFDFQLDWTPAPDKAAAPPDLFTAIQRQLGLQLRSVKALVDVLVIERIEKPAEN
jgi:uncharacterized protein (TIGR03435 family)